MTQITGTTIIDNIAIAGVKVYSQAVMNYTVSSSETSYSFASSNALYMSSQPGWSYGSPAAKVDYVIEFLVDNQRSSISYGYLDWNTIPSGTTPSSVSLPALIKNQSITRTHAAQTVVFSYRIQTGFYTQGSNTWSTATYTMTVPAKNSYSVTYNANGGSGAPSQQTKWYGEALTLSTGKPTRTGYTFQGWATSSTSSTVAYASGASYTGNAALSLFAVWKAANPPTASSISCGRAVQNGSLDDEGTYAAITATYSVDTAGNANNKVTRIVTTLGSVTDTQTPNLASGNISLVIGGSFDVSTTYSGTIVFTDSNNRTTTKTIKLSPAAYPFDAMFSNNQYGVGILAPASAVGKVEIGGDVDIHGENVYIGNNTDASLIAHTTGRNASVMECYGGDSNGAGISISNGGLTVIGGGESGHNLYKDLTTVGGISATTERMYIASDNNAYIATNCQTVTNDECVDKKIYTFNTSGDIYGPNNSAVQFSGTTGQIYLVTASDGRTDGYRMQLALSGGDTAPCFRKYDGSAWGSWSLLAQRNANNSWTAAQQQIFSGNKNWSEKDTVVDLVAADNGLPSDTTRYHEWLSYDKNGKIPGGVSNTIASGGNVSTQLRCRNYQTGGEGTPVSNDLTLRVTKGGGREVTVTDKAPWITGLGYLPQQPASTYLPHSTATSNTFPLVLGNTFANNGKISYMNPGEFCAANVGVYYSPSSATQVNVANTSLFRFLVILFRTNSATYTSGGASAAAEPLNSTIVHINKKSSGNVYVSLNGNHQMSSTSVQFRSGLATIACSTTAGKVTLSAITYVNLTNGSAPAVGTDSKMALVGVIGVY